MTAPDVAAYDERSIADLLDLSGRVALVTGAAQGFGFACARRLAEAGAAVLLTDRRARPRRGGRRAARRVRRPCRRGRSATCRCATRSTPWSATAVERFGRLDVLVNNAAAYYNVRIDEMPLDTFANVLDVNVNGAFWCARQAARRMLEQGDGGAIVNVTSIDALHPTSKGMSHYTTSKHALWGLTKCLALELGPHGHPHERGRARPVADRGRDRVHPGRRARRASTSKPSGPRPPVRVPMRRWAEPDEIAARRRLPRIGPRGLRQRRADRRRRRLPARLLVNRRSAARDGSTAQDGRPVLVAEHADRGAGRTRAESRSRLRRSSARRRRPGPGP